MIVRVNSETNNPNNSQLPTQIARRIERPNRKPVFSRSADRTIGRKTFRRHVITVKRRRPRR